MQNNQFDKVVMIPTKNVFLAALLAAFFGPLGMFYSTVTGAIIMLILYPIVFLLTFGLGLYILHPIIVIWAAVHANNYNKKLLSGSKDVPRQNINVEVSVQAPSEPAQAKAIQAHPRREIKPGFVESVMAKGLISQARQLESAGDKDSSEQARQLWEGALKVGGLSAEEELLCHYYLGSYYFGQQNIPEGINHNQLVVLHDPNLSFLQETNDAVKSRLQGDLYKNLSAGYQSHARIVKEKQGVKAAIEYLQGKVSILGHMAAPSILYELGSYFMLFRNREKAEDAMRRALEAPSYGSAFQEDSKKLAEDFLSKKDNLESSKGEREEPIKIDQPLILGPEPREKNLRPLFWIAGGAIVVGAIFALIILLRPNQYMEYLGKAREAFTKGDYSEALALVNLAKEKKSTAELSALNDAIRKEIHVKESLAAAAKQKREYDDNYEKALEAFKAEKYEASLIFAKQAAENNSTQEIRRLIDILNRRITEQKQHAMQIADDNAYSLALRANNQNAFSEYLRLYPNGMHRAEATSKLFEFGAQQNLQLAAKPGGQDTQSYNSTRNALPNVNGYWELMLEGSTTKTMIRIIQNGSTISVVRGQYTYAGNINGDKITWTERHSSPQTRAEMTFQGRTQGNTMSGTATRILFSSTRGTRNSPARKWTANRK